MDMNRIVISDAGVYVGDTLYNMSIDDIITKIGIEKCARFGRVYYQVTERAITKMLTSELCWKCAMCPVMTVIEGKICNYNTVIEEVNSVDELIAECNTQIDSMKCMMNSMRLRLTAHMVGRWLTLLSRNRWVTGLTGININVVSSDDSVRINAEDGNGESLYANMMDDAVAFGVIELKAGNTFNVDMYIQLSDELYKKGCTVYSIEVDEDINVLYVVGKCSTNRMITILEEVTMYKEYSDKVEYIGYCKYHNTDMLDAVDFTDID